MDAEQFYEDFKDALNYLGAGFHGKDQVAVRLDGREFCMTFCGRETRLALPTGAQTAPQPADPSAS